MTSWQGIGQENLAIYKGKQLRIKFTELLIFIYFLHRPFPTIAVIPKAMNYNRLASVTTYPIIQPGVPITHVLLQPNPASYSICMLIILVIS